MDKKISQLGATITAGNTDLLAIVQGGVTKKITFENLGSSLSSSSSFSLANILVNGNDTDGTHIILNESRIKSPSNDVQIYFGPLGDSFTVTTDAYGNIKPYLSLLNSGIATLGLNEGYYQVDSGNSLIHHDLQIKLDAPVYNFAQLSPSVVPYLDASSNLIESTITPIELSYLSGATSNIQGQISGLVSGVSSWKDTCIVATTGNVTLSGEQTIDGVLTSSTRILVWVQSNPVENGIYVTGAGSWTRATDFDNNTDKISGASVVVQKGTSYANHEFICSSDAPVVVGTDAINFIDYLANYIGTANRITVTGNVIDISATFESLLGKVASPLSQFAATTSAQLAGVISDETGTGALVFGTSPTFSTSIIAGYATASTIAIFDGSKNLVSAPLVTYPSLTELSYGKGVTSSIQTQLNAKDDHYTATSVKTSNYSASPSELIPCNVTGGGFTVALPPAPADKSRILIKLVATNGTNVLTFTTGGTDVINLAGGVTSGTLSALNQAMELHYVASTGIWYAFTSITKSYIDTKTGIVARSTTDGTPVTGTTANSILYAEPISAATFSPGHFISTFDRIGKSGNNNTAIVRMYFNTSASLSGATLAATLNFGATTRTGDFGRILIIKSSTITETIAVGNNQTDNFFSTSTSAAAQLNIDWTVQQYRIIAITMASASDTATHLGGYNKID